MSRNTLSLGPRGSPPLQPGESLLASGNTADIELRIPATMDGPKRVESAKGQLWLTDLRIIFVADSGGAGSSSSSSSSAAAAAPPSYDASEGIRSLVIPYSVLISSTFHLPTFSPNHLLLSFLPDLSPSAPSNLPTLGRGGKLEVKLLIGEGAGHEVWKRIEGERGRWEDIRRREGEEALPVYTPN
ncbi:hypothetical protein EHS25_010124 [Saitozyma podzolica]|uniref:Uncharacterized protein n=1 Tax=Saitozyma podzolica TaxID=1890683 RepID=A0A427YIN5_9TREE|nr:hypothetical protein EHS25_010124 [Saitozyma podzolica]